MVFEHCNHTHQNTSTRGVNKLILIVIFGKQSVGKRKAFCPNMIAFNTNVNHIPK